MKGRGCGTCNNTGYKGRVALYEVMPFTDPLKELVLQGASAAEIKAEMIRGGMQSLRMAGIAEDPRGHDDARRSPAHHGGRLTWPQLNLQALLKAMLDKGASDLHITAGSPPRLRIDGELVRLQTEPLTPVDTKTLCYSVMNDAQKLRFEEDLEIDFSFGIRSLARFRANVYMQQACVAGAFRIVPYKIIPLEDLGLPPVVTELCDKPRGLVLVTGPTGSGKSTTLASMIDRINTRMRGHIVTIEDPIEFQHTHKECARQPARDRPRHASRSSARSSTSCARIPTSC